MSRRNNACFADTSYFLSLLVAADEYHNAARRWAGSSRRPLVTTEYVVIEVGNFLSRPPGRMLFGDFVKALKAAPHLTLIAAAGELRERGTALYLSRPDKSWSLTDCISFVVMQEHGISEALTNDHHFEQAGFRALLVDRGS